MGSQSALSGVGCVGAVGMLGMSLTGLAAFIYALQDTSRFTSHAVPAVPLLMGLGIFSTMSLGAGLFGTVVLAHLGLPLSAVKAHVVSAGGSFGRRLFWDPVQLPTRWSAPSNQSSPEEWCQ